MALHVKHVVVGARDPAAQARFWAAVFGATVRPDSMGFSLTPPAGSTPMLFIPVGESETRPVWPTMLITSAEGALAEHVQSLLDLGASMIDDAPRGRLIHFGLGSVIMADPEGNPFTIESTDAERHEVARTLDAGQEVDTSRSYFAGCAPDPQFMSTAQVRIKRESTG